MTVRSSSGIPASEASISERVSLETAAASGPIGASAPPMTTPARATRSSPPVSEPSSSWPGGRDQRRPPAGRAKAVDRPVPGDRMQPGGERPGRRIERRRTVPQREERVLDHLFRDASIRCQPGCDGEDRGAVPVIEVRQGVVRAARDRADEGDVVGATRTVLGHDYAGPGPSVSSASTRRSGRRSNAVERTMSVSLVKTLGIAWSRTITASRWRVSRARILRR